MTSLSRHLKILIGVNVTAVVLLALAVGGFYSYYDDRFDPGTQVSGILISGLSPTEAEAKLAAELELDTLPSVSIKTETVEIASSASELGLFYPVADHLDIIWET